MDKNAMIIRNAGQIVTMSGQNDKPRVGPKMRQLGLLNGKDHSIGILHGKIVAIGSENDVLALLNERGQESSKANGNHATHIECLDADGKLVMPGLIDPHTHIVFSGAREYELEMRMNGATYLDILEQGGGILATTRMTRQASVDQLIDETWKRLDSFLLHGVTTLEAKSGYGLTVEDELKQLRVAKRLNQQHPIDLVSTFMGAHAVPPEYKGSSDHYVQIVIEQMLPLVAKEKLAKFCDVFCEHGVFTLEQSEAILEAGKRYGLSPKIHADEIEPMGGAELAAKVGAISADHLLRASDQGIKAMAQSGVVATLLPGTAFFLMTQPARARAMIEAGVPVALSTDRNPGSSPTENLQLIMNLACLQMKMTPAEVIAATTINAAHAIGAASRVGSLEPGKQADIAIMNADSYQFLQYHYGVNLVDTVIKAGKVVVKGGSLVYDQ